MTPAQKLALEAKLSSQRVNQLVTWLDQNRRMVGEGEAGLRETLRTLLGRFDGLQQAIDLPPTIGVIGEVGSGKSQLVRALTASSAIDANAARVSEPEILRNILLSDPDLRCTAAVRFRSAGSAAAGREHPFRIGLLGLADLAAIMARIYCTGCPKARVSVPRLDRVAAIYDEVSRNLQAGTVPGFTDRDVFALRDTLDSQFPEAESLKLLSAAGYWNDLAEVAAHIPDAERLKVLSLLWGEEAQITHLFTHLGEALARLGFVTEAFCPREALIELDGTSGWLRPHKESILDIATLSRLGDDKGSTLHVVGRYGQASTVTRAAMAALISDLSLAVASGPLAAMKPTEIIEFPGFMPAGELALGLGMQGADLGSGPGTGTSAGNDATPHRPNGADDQVKGCSRDQLVRLYAHAKLAHLFDRACQRNEVTSLVVCVDPEAPVNDTLQPAIADWIDFAQGFDPYQREQRRTGLLVVATDASGRQNGHGGSNRGPLIDENGMAADLCDVVAGEEAWPGEWTPGRPFLNVVAVRPTARAERQPAARRLRGATERGGQDGAHGAVQGSTASHDASAYAVLRSVAEASQTSNKQRQLRRQLAELHRRLRSRFLRFHGDGDLVEWRQRVGATIDHRLYRVVRNGRLGLLLKALMIGDRELHAVYRRCLRQSFNVTNELDGDQVLDLTALPLQHGAADLVDASGGIGQARALRLAAAAVAHWHTAMRRSARSSRLCRAIGLGEPLIEHIIDEIGIAAVRLGLVRSVADAIETAFAACASGNGDGAAGDAPFQPAAGTSHAADAPDLGERLFASAVGPVLNGFVEVLQVGGGSSDAGAAAPGATAEVGPGGMPEIVWQDPAMFATRLADRWCAALSRMIEANVAASRFHHATGHNSDLGRLLAQLPISHLEVEL
ncbi:MAG: hypothetical protein JNM89_13815 [Hyphomicrobiaceae bacterium]|nr:hypothetical protein [Hyphomicrobiaceae bacterium]